MATLFFNAFAILAVALISAANMGTYKHMALFAARIKGKRNLDAFREDPNMSQKQHSAEFIKATFFNELLNLYSNDDE